MDVLKIVPYWYKFLGVDRKIKDVSDNVEKLETTTDEQISKLNTRIDVFNKYVDLWFSEQTETNDELEDKILEVNKGLVSFSESQAKFNTKQTDVNEKIASIIEQSATSIKELSEDVFRLQKQVNALIDTHPNKGMAKNIRNK